MEAEAFGSRRHEKIRLPARPSHPATVIWLGRCYHVSRIYPSTGGATGFMTDVADGAEELWLGFLFEMYFT